TFGVTANSVTVLRNFPAKFIEIVLTQGDTVDRFGDNRSAAKCEATGRRPYTGRDPASQLAAGTDASAGERHPSAQQGASSGGSATQDVTRTDGSRSELLLNVPARLIGGGPDSGKHPAGCLNGGTHAFRNHGFVLADVPRRPVRRISQALDGGLASFDPAHPVPLNRNDADTAWRVQRGQRRAPCAALPGFNRPVAETERRIRARRAIAGLKSTAAALAG